MWTHGLISDETYEKLRLACQFDVSEHASKECNKVFDIAEAEEGNIDAYSIYTPTCKKTSLHKRRLIRGRTVVHLLRYQHTTFLCSETVALTVLSALLKV